MTEKSGYEVLIESGAEFAGKALPKALIGFLTSGPPGAITGALIGATEASWGLTIKFIGKEISERLLGIRGAQRIGAVLSWAHEKFQQNIAKGQSAKMNYLHNEIAGHRSPGDENLEAVLLAAQKEYEEKKLPFLATLMGNLPFQDEIGKEHANQLIRLAELLSYRQLQILILACQPETAKKEVFCLLDSDYRGKSNFPVKTISVLQDVLELYHKGMINFGGGAVLGMTGINPVKMMAQGNGYFLVELMELEKIPLDEQISISKDFSF